MKVSIDFLPEFARNLKRYGKKYKSLAADYAFFLESLQSNPFQGDDLGNGVRKVRMAVSSKGKGKSGGMRVVTYCINVITDEEINITLLTIYDKSEIQNISDAYLKWLVNELNKKIVVLRKPILNIVTLGCSKNKVDSEHLAALLEKHFLIRHDSDRKSDVVMINTCGFIGDAQEESIDTILEYAELRKQNKISKLYVMGCLSQRFRKELQEEIHEVDAWYGVESVDKVAADILKEDVPCGFVTQRVLSTPKHYAYLKISEGCNRRCAFCAIPLIRGSHVSVPMNKLLEEAQMLAKKGVRELILIAQDLTYYGIDLDGKPHIVELVKELCKIDGFEWIRLHYGYPLGFPNELLDLMRENPKLCHYIDLPLQHISTLILKRMRRGVDREQTIGFVENVRKHVPDIAFRTTFIVGFPGETEADFEELCQFVRDMRFERAGVFAYSPEEGTPAYEMEDDVPDEVKQERVDRLMAIQQDISLEINGMRVGKTEKVLVDRLEGDYYIARSQYDSPEVDDEILIPADNELEIGQFYQVKITQADYFDCYAEIVDE